MNLSDKAYSEKRNFIRMKIDTMVTFTVEGGNERYDGRCKNLSGNGMLMETGKKLTAGNRLDIVIPSENSEFANLNALVEVLRVIPLPEQHMYEVGVVIQSIKT